MNYEFVLKFKVCFKTWSIFLDKGKNSCSYEQAKTVFLKWTKISVIWLYFKFNLLYLKVRHVLNMSQIYAKITQFKKKKKHSTLY